MANAVGAATLAAVIVTICSVVTLAGAVYNPDVLIVPAPVAGVIAHVTAVLLVLVTFEVNCCACPP